MWDTLQQQSFVLGAVLVLVYQAAKFGEWNLGDPVTSRFVALLPDARVRDFASPRAYGLALGAFLVLSFIGYFLCCQISPSVLNGAAKLFGPEAEKLIKDVPYPLYIAALFMGLTQPIIPGFAQFEVAQRNFFHDQIEVPRRIVDLTEQLTTAIEARAGADRKRLAEEVRRLAGDDFLATLAARGDLAFYRLQLDKLEIGNGALDAVVKDSSVRELRALVERLVVTALVAVMRKSGPGALGIIPEKLGVVLEIRRGNPGVMIGSLIASGLLFSLGLLVIAHLLSLLDGPVASLVGRTVATSMWPSSLDSVGDELSAIVPPISACLALAVFMLAPRGEIRDGGVSSGPDATRLDDFLDFVRSSTSVIVLCILTAVLIKVSQMFYEYGTIYLPAEARTLSRLTLPVIQSFVAVPVSLLATWYLVSERRVPRRGLSFGATVLAIAGTTAFVALLYDLTFLDQYLPVHPDARPGVEHALFAVVANALVAVSAFASVAVFFRTRGRLAQQLGSPSACSGEVDPVRR